MNPKLNIFVALLLGLWGVLVFAVDPQHPETQELGQNLVKEVWSYMKTNDVKALTELMTDGFQSAHQDGSRNKAEELKLIGNLHMGDYYLTNFQSTLTGNTLIVTYFVSVPETIDGNKLQSEPTLRMTVFVREGTQWKWAAHANLRPLKS